MPLEELEETGQEVIVLLYIHNHGTDAGVYTDMDAARLGMAEVIRHWAPDAEATRLLDEGKLDEARKYFEESTDEHFDFVPAQVRNRRLTALEECARSLDDHDAG